MRWRLIVFTTELVLLLVLPTSQRRQLQLQAIEQAAGRERPYRNAQRTLDLDILLYGDEGMPVTTCGGCDRDLDEYEVVPAPRPLPGVLRRYRDAVRGRGDARADLRDEMQEWGADE